VYKKLHALHAFNNLNAVKQTGGTTMKMIKGVLLGALVALPLAGLADTNVTWKSSIGLGATVKHGNTDKTLFTMNLKGDRYAENSDLKSSLYGEYGETEGSQTEGNLRGQADYRYKFGDKNFFGGVFSEAHHDALKDIYLRVKIGPNIGYYFINEGDQKLDASAGINWGFENTATDKRGFGEWRVAANYLHDFTETASYYCNIEYSASFDDFEDGSGLLVTGLKSKINTQLSMFVELRDEYDNQPGTGIQHNDITMVAGLTYDFM
jgi:hypothetical protein